MPEMPLSIATTEMPLLPLGIPTVSMPALPLGLANITTMICVIIYGVGFQFAWGTVPWIYPAEIFSMNEKEKAVSIAVCLNYVANAAVVIITPFLMTWSTPGTLFFFGALNCVNFMFVWVFVRETKGVPLEDVPQLFEEESEYDSSEGSDSEE